MTGFPRSPRLVKGGIVQLDPASGAVRNIIALQYNPDSLTRGFQVQDSGDQHRRRSQPLRFTAPPVETVKVEAELDAADQLEFPDRFADAAQVGVHPQLAVLEMLVRPTVDQLVAADRSAAAGSLEILPMEAPVTVFVWSAARIVPVRVTELSVTEEAFDPALNPLRAKVQLGMRVLTVNDVGFAHRAGGMFLAHQRRLEALAARAGIAAFPALGVGGVT
ncbi:hypothetical protein OIE73_03480 [Streptomyces hirsutus]|uniref:Uncharacterized protein n=1 Tax=Streptomyces hirsutus TaxID=35620 RepID=A0ABZ1GHZ4_9ACTN|nr:hypothetical protein [Streptomyces hirsutus]WSD04907.1 hypothetical protein OIE73_03480 [Streptomyces hirsutus]